MRIVNVQSFFERKETLYELSLIIGGSLLIWYSAKVAVYLPFSPVPITAQTLAISLIGALYGAKRGVLTVLTYLFEGMIGLPVFAGGGGIFYLFGPTGGYLIGFVVSTYVIGKLIENKSDMKSMLIALLTGNAVLYLFGLSWLGVYVGYDRVLKYGLYPFIPGDTLKILIAVSILIMMKRLQNS